MTRKTVAKFKSKRHQICISLLRYDFIAHWKAPSSEKQWAVFATLESGSSCAQHADLLIGQTSFVVCHLSVWAGFLRRKQRKRPICVSSVRKFRKRRLLTWKMASLLSVFLSSLGFISFSVCSSGPSGFSSVCDHRNRHSQTSSFNATRRLCCHFPHECIFHF